MNTCNRSSGQTLWNWGAGHPPAELTQERMDYFVDRLIWSISYRFLLSLKLERADRLRASRLCRFGADLGQRDLVSLPAPGRSKPLR
ncbi:MAG: hypothetical protein R2838_07125 [Caldilineaceae bacterium]